MNRGALPLNALRAFEAAARLGRMTAAASELGVTHGAISRQVKVLEASLGVALFAGPRNRPILTASGQRLLPELTAAFERIDGAVRLVADEEAGTLDVSCLGTLTMRWLIPRLDRFQSRHPGISVRLTSDHLPVDFHRDSFDVAIRVGSGDWPSGAVVTPMFGDRMGPVLSPALAAQVVIDDPVDLAALPWLHAETRLYAWTEWCRAHGLTKIRAGQRFERHYFMLEGVMAGLGVAIAPQTLVGDDIAAGRLIAPFGFIPSGRQYVALSRAGSSRKVRAFVD